MQKLNDICFCEAKANSGDEFVGIRCVKSNDGKFETRIDFPLGYFKGDVAIRELTEDTVRENVMNLFAVLSDADLMSKVREDSSIAAMLEEMKTTAFPMLAYLNVIRNYLDNGYITEREVEYKRKAHGKVNWNRTIKMTKPVIDEDESNLVYLDLIARKVNYNEDCLITLVHKFCVHDALNRLGFLFGIEPTEEPILDFDYELFCSAVNAKLSKTFNDRDLHLLSDLAKIIEFLAEHQTEDGINTEYYFGVNKFAPMWEAMVDRIFATISREEKRDKYNPHLKFVAFGSANSDGENYQDDDNEGADEERKRSTLRPDTIMQNGENIFILDSKYYKYGLKGNLCYLPGADSVCKQMAYAEYVEKERGVNSECIFNAFVMPYCVEADNRKLPPDADSETRPLKMRYAGYIYGDWKKVPDANHPYHKIACILLDLKSVMECYTSSLNARAVLANLISSKVKS